MRSVALVLLLLPSLAVAADPPGAVISNGQITAKFHLPDPANGYYRGTRFDWSGVIHSLQYKGHEFFGVWFDKYDPKLHDAITGPVEEFLTGETALGFDAAPIGGKFIRIGAGVLKKDAAKFERFKTYEILDPGQRKLSRKANSLTFTHTLTDKETGYAYQYEKTLRLVANSPVLVIEHKLKNTGTKPIVTDSYNHNFFVIDGTPTGPEMTVDFAFTPQISQPLAPLAGINGQQLRYTRELAKGESTYTEMSGFSTDPKQYSLRIANQKTKASVRITGDRPLSKVVYWSIRSTLCPEPYVHMDIAPGQTFTWSIRYEFQVD